MIEITPFPKLPPEIKEAVSNEKIVIFIGAGTSRVIGCSGWEEIANQLIDVAFKSKKINFQEKEKIIDKYGPKKTISILKRILLEKDYKDTLINSVKADNNKLRKYLIYEEIFKMRGIYLTTNIDEYFDRYFEAAKIFIRPNQFELTNIKPISLFHLHGSLSDFNTIIFTTPEYIAHYNKIEVIDFLKFIFVNFTVLFVGYSLSELEILDYVLLKGGINNYKKHKESKHFILLPFFKTEQNIFKFEQEYFANLNVSAIPYAIDENGYDQLFHVIKAWQREINITSTFLHKSFQYIEQNINEYDEKKSLEILQLIKNDEHIRNHFFKKVTISDWFFPLKERSYFDPKKAPGPRQKDKKNQFWIPFWNVLPYLERISIQVKLKEKEKYIDELLQIIENVSNYRNSDGKHLDNYHTWWYFVKILLNIPNEKIPLKIIQLISIWLDSRFDTDLHGADVATKLLPKFLNSNKKEDWNRAEKIVEFITDIKWIPIPKERRNLLHAQKEEAKTVVDTHWILESIKKNADKIGRNCNENIIFILANRLKDIFKKEYPKGKFIDFSQFWFSLLFDEPDIGKYGTKETISLYLRDIFLAKSKIDVSKTTKIINKFLGSDYNYPFFNRLVLYVIGKEWELYKKIFWHMVKEDKDKFLFNKSVFFPEVYKILEINILKFEETEKNLIKEIIDKGPREEIFEEDKIKGIAYWKQKWLSAVKDDPEFTQLYQKQKEITKWEEDVKFRRIEIKWGEGSSPLSKDEILSMPNDKLVNFIIKFKEKDRWKGPTVGGLSVMLKMSVQEKPEKFINDLDPFLKLGYRYIYEILHGIKEAWNAKKSFNWGNFFNFILNYINRDGFWIDELKVAGDGYPAIHYWIIGIVGELIQEGTKDDDWAFPENFLKKAKKILFEIIGNEAIKQDKEDIEDSVTFALNSTYGKLITALIYLALRIDRLEDKKNKKKAVRWPLDVKKKYEYLFNKEIIEAYILFGQYMPQLNYLDKTWVKEKVEKAFPKIKSKLWEAFISGYLCRSIVYIDLYKLMRNHYSKGISYSFKEKNAQESLVQHISLGYLLGEESLHGNSLFRVLLNKWNQNQIKEIINYFWMQNENVEINKKKEERIKIVEFWRWIFNKKFKNKSNLTKKDKEILSELSKLTIFLNKIEAETSKWLLASAHFVHKNFNSPNFIECLDKLKDRNKDNIKYIGEIFLKMIKDFNPDYDQVHIASIVDSLYESKDNVSADKICNIYGERGYEFLRETYEKYHEDSS